MDIWIRKRLKQVKFIEIYREWIDILDFVRRELNKERKIKPDEDPYNYKFPQVIEDTPK